MSFKWILLVLLARTCRLLKFSFPFIASENIYQKIRRVNQCAFDTIYIAILHRVPTPPFNISRLGFNRSDIKTLHFLPSWVIGHTRAIDSDALNVYSQNIYWHADPIERVRSSYGSCRLVTLPPRWEQRTHTVGCHELVGCWPWALNRRLPPKVQLICQRKWIQLQNPG